MPTLPRPRGSVIIVAVVLLTVLAIIGVAAVSLSSQERQNAAVKSRRDVLVACAQASQAAVWAELLKFGPQYLGATTPIASKITLSDGTQLTMGHYREDPAVTLVSQAVREVPCTRTEQPEVIDLTNRDNFIRLSGHCYLITAHCTDRASRELEVEFGINTIF